MCDLSQRETQVLIFLGDGATSDQIAHALGIASDTVNHHIAKIRSKFAARNRIEAVALALRSDSIPINDGERPSVVEVQWAEDGSVGDLIVRYGAGDSVRGAPKSMARVLDSSVTVWAGENWRDDLAPLIAALEGARATGRRTQFQGVKVELDETGEEMVSLGWVEPMGEDRFLAIDSAPIPTS